MKKICIFGLVVFLALVGASCGDNDKSQRVGSSGNGSGGKKVTAEGLEGLWINVKEIESVEADDYDEFCTNSEVTSKEDQEPTPSLSAITINEKQEFFHILPGDGNKSLRQSPVVGTINNNGLVVLSQEMKTHNLQKEKQNHKDCMDTDNDLDNYQKNLEQHFLLNEDDTALTLVTEYKTVICEDGKSAKETDDNDRPFIYMKVSKEKLKVLHDLNKKVCIDGEQPPTENPIKDIDDDENEEPEQDQNDNPDTPDTTTPEASNSETAVGGVACANESATNTLQGTGDPSEIESAGQLVALSQAIKAKCDLEDNPLSDQEALNAVASAADIALGADHEIVVEFKASLDEISLEE